MLNIVMKMIIIILKGALPLFYKYFRCISGRECKEKICENGGTCIKTGMTETCYCPQGFSGENCQSEVRIIYCRDDKY